MKKINSVRGMNDFLPDKMEIYRNIENVIKNILISYGFNEIKLPILEKSILFKKIVGNSLVYKEMYEFKDKNNENLTLRPEGTIGCVRSGIENGFIYNGINRIWYSGPMFRHERPQKIRYRQFYQLGCEIFGEKGFESDLEVLFLSYKWWKNLNIDKYLKLEINSIGSINDRLIYCNDLVKFLKKNIKFLNENCLRQLKFNPLRILDSKDLFIQNLLKDAPIILDYINNKSLNNFIEIKKNLDIFNIPYMINNLLVRGLDYYTDTVFEWKFKINNNKYELCSGGRYDNMIKQIGGKRDIPAIGLAVGIDRLLYLINIKKINIKNNLYLNIFVIYLEKYIFSYAISISEKIRDKLNNIKLIIGYKNTNLKKQLSNLSKNGTQIVLILGENEIKSNKIVMKNLIEKKQYCLNIDDIINKIVCFRKENKL